jgi:hypothetical protein
MVIIEVRAGEEAQEQVEEDSLQYQRQGCGLSIIEMVIIEVRAGEGYSTTGRAVGSVL